MLRTLIDDYWYSINPCCDECRSASYTNKTMSECNFVVINWAVRAKPAGLSFLIVNLGVPWTLPIYVFSRNCPKRVVVFFFRREVVNQFSSPNVMNICNFRTQYGTDIAQNANKGYWRHIRFLRVVLCHFCACPTRCFGVDLCLFC